MIHETDPSVRRGKDVPVLGSDLASWLPRGLEQAPCLVTTQRLWSPTEKLPGQNPLLGWRFLGPSLQVRLRHLLSMCLNACGEH